MLLVNVCCQPHETNIRPVMTANHLFQTLYITVKTERRIPFNGTQV